MPVPGSAAQSTRSTCGAVFDLLSKHLPRYNSKAWHAQGIGRDLKLASLYRVLMEEHDIVWGAAAGEYAKHILLAIEAHNEPWGWVGTRAPFSRFWACCTKRNLPALRGRSPRCPKRRPLGAGQQQPCRAWCEARSFEAWGLRRLIRMLSRLGEIPAVVPLYIIIHSCTQTTRACHMSLWSVSSCFV